MSWAQTLRRAGIALAVTFAIVAGVFVLSRGQGPSAALGARRAAAATPATPAPSTPTRLTALPSRVVANGTAALGIRLSGVPAPTTPRPWFEPHVAGSWSTSGDYETFTPASTLEPCTSYAMTIPANTVAVNSVRLGRQRTIGLTVSCPSVKGLQLALMRLGYLPASFHSRYGVHLGPNGPEARRLAAIRAFRPPAGAMVPDRADAPPVAYGSGSDGATIGAVDVFQEDHGMTPTGVPDVHTWAAILAAETMGHGAREPYTWVTVSESIPQTLQVHRGHHVVLSSPTNTGVAGAPTALGIFPIFSRFTSTTMSGTNPDGSKYVDPGVPWVNYFNGGDAVHGFVRPSYGVPQSDGCVELPVSTAAAVYPMLRIGDIVWVT